MGGTGDEDFLRYLASHFASLLAPTRTLESKGFIWGKSHEGTTQGDPESGPHFCITIQRYGRSEDKELADVGGCARFRWDGGYLLSPADKVFSSLEKFSTEAQHHCGLQLQKLKKHLE